MARTFLSERRDLRFLSLENFADKRVRANKKDSDKNVRATWSVLSSGNGSAHPGVN